MTSDTIFAGRIALFDGVDAGILVVAIGAINDSLFGVVFVADLSKVPGVWWGV
jgi:hypothetical protein